MGDRKVYPSVPCCHLWEKKLFPHPSGSLATCLLNVSARCFTSPPNMDPIYKAPFPAYSLPLTRSLGPFASPSSVIIRATGHRGKEPEFCSCSLAQEFRTAGQPRSLPEPECSV